MNKDTVAKNLIRLRSVLDKTQEEIAEKAGISIIAYRNIESGSSEPKASTLQGLAEALEVDINELFKPVRELNCVRFRAKKAMKKRSNVLYAVSTWLDRYTALENKLPENKLDNKIDSFRKKISYLKDDKERAKKAAEELRKELEIEAEPIRDICGLIEKKLGIKIYTKTFNSDSFFGLSLEEKDSGPAIVVNIWDRISLERRIFSTAHELGHLILHFNSNSYDITKKVETDSDMREEKEADKFASYFLIPEKTFITEWNNCTLYNFIDRVFKVKKIFNVSYQVVLYRLSEYFKDKDIDVWKKFHWEYKKKYNKSLTKVDEPYSLVNNDLELDALSGKYYGNHLSYLVKLAVEKKLISNKEGANILEVNFETMKSLRDSWVFEIK